MKRVAFHIILILSLSTCSKNSSRDEDGTAPFIVISNPSDGHTYTAGQSIDINGTITDNKALAEVHIHVNNAATGAKLLDVHTYPNGNTIPFLNNDLTATAGTTYKIEIIATDRSANLTRSIITVSCN